jgi:hypothetical protein
MTGRTPYIICGRKQLHMKIVGFWDVMCNLVEEYQHFLGTCYLHFQGSLFYPEDGGSRFLRNYSTHLKLLGVKSQKILILICYTPP